MFRTKVKEAFQKRNKFSIKALLNQIKGYIGWILILGLCLCVSLILCSQIGIWTRSWLIIDGYTALKDLGNMNVLSYFNGHFFNVIANLSEAQIAAVSKMLMLFMTVAYGLFVLTYSIVEAIKAKKNGTLRLSKPSRWRIINLLGCVLFIGILNAITEIIIMLVSPLMAGAGNELEAANALSTSGGPLITILCAGIFAPIVEELLFRKGLQKALSYFNPVFSLVFTSISFGIMHGNILQILFAMFMGFALGFVYEVTDNIFYPICMHIFVNVTGCIISIFKLNEYISYPVAIIVPLVLMFAIIGAKRTNMLEVKQ